MAISFSYQWVVIKAEYSFSFSQCVEGAKPERSTFPVLSEISVFQLSNFTRRKGGSPILKVHGKSTVVDHSRFLV